MTVSLFFYVFTVKTAEKTLTIWHKHVYWIMLYNIRLFWVWSTKVTHCFYD